MGKVGKKKSFKGVGSFPKKNKSSQKKKRRSKTFNQKNIVKKRFAGIANVNNNLNTKYQKIPRSNTNLNIDSMEGIDTEVINNEAIDSEVIEIKDDSFLNDTSSEETVVPNTVNDITTIDITNISDEVNKNYQTIPSKITAQQVECDDVIDITDTSLVTSTNAVNEDSQSIIEYISSSEEDNLNDVGIISIITLSDDSDDEKTQRQLSILKPKQESKEEHLNSSTYPTNKLKRKYNSPLRLHNGTKTMINEKLPESNFGAFVIDKQRIPINSEDYIRVEKKRHFTPSSKITDLANRKLRPIVIDGLNIGYKHGGGGTFSAKGIEICIEFFAKRGHKDILAFIPEHRQGPPGSDTNIILNKLDKNGHICFTPSRKVQNLRMTCYDDRIILNYAHKCGGVVISNDYYRDLYNESEEFKDIIENRQVMVTFARDEILVPEDQYNRKNDVRSLAEILSFPA